MILPQQPFTGIVSLSLEAPEIANPEGLDWAIDGRFQPRLNASYQGTVKLDTTKLADGVHRLDYFSWALGPPITLVYSGGFQFTTSNGNTSASYPKSYSVGYPLQVGSPLPSLGPVIPRSMLGLSATELLAIPYSSPLLLAGLNAYEDQFFALGAFPQSRVIPGWYFFGLADDLCRTAAEQEEVLNDPTLLQIAELKAEQLFESGMCLGILAVDESSFQIKPGPTNPVVAPVVAMLRAAGLKACWPNTVGVHSGPLQAAWCSSAYSDFGCVYYNCLDENYGYPNQLVPSLSQFRDMVSQALGQIPSGVPRMCLIKAMGNFYYKETPGGSCYLPSDTLVTGAIPPEAIMCQVGVALVYGACGIRYWLYDTKGQIAARQGPLGGLVVEGVGPTSPLPESAVRWNAISLCNNAIQDLQSLLLGPVAAAPNWGSDWEVGARAGLTFGVNCTSRVLQSPVPPTWVLTKSGRIPGPAVPPGGWAVVLS